ncbi:hypothetical protein CHGG_07903 [Chaetomium globosum CBS 148.51]|uniref:Uncharacterized protein n=1 Tax=Chaetomium globosum (strain ATCC 6205 / CBS 148.51 / DSM 1962 / NBRC 6347 / NRRL 1970) TaxID=306901 RepID=Q2GVV1_CHAGB|nr:uncharacterized protein CHGG_07903 [Chaetomium globosum CBS 148.51]EAQ86650.1 hypothetical protein CHGG_07903 [Chaetomium globosum CBS 148.51]
MRAWLTAKAEEDKRRQEEERTRQEGYRLEQRRMEHEILRTSLEGGIPPPLVPVVFAGMGGGALSPAALDWAQQYMMSQTPQQHPPALMPPVAVSSEHQRRDSQAPMYGQYPVSGGAIPSTPGSAQGPPSTYAAGYPGSPTRPRGLSMPGTMAGRPSAGTGSNLPSLVTNAPGGPGQQSGLSQHQQEPQASPSIYFHHWQPPTTQGGGRGGAEQPATPSVGESPRKRKAPGPQQAAPPPSTHRHRSPPFLHSTGLSNPPPGRRRGHSRQRSDLGSYRPGAGRGRAESLGPGRETSPMHTAGAGPARDNGEPLSSTQHQGQVPAQFAPPPAQAPSGRVGAHSVSSLLSDNPQSPRATTHFASGNPSEGRHQQHHQHHHHQMQQQQQHGLAQFGENERRQSPRSSEEKLRGGGGVQGSTATRPGDNS